MKSRAPRAVLIENVMGLASSHGGSDLASAIARLNVLGYVCDVFTIDAARFVPQSRPRLFIIGSNARIPGTSDWSESEARPAWVSRFVASQPSLEVQALPLRLPASIAGSLSDVVEHLDPCDDRWWERGRLARFQASLTALQARRLDGLRRGLWLSHAASYRRTRPTGCRWEIRADSISGCLRTTGGGSSKQALVEAGEGRVRVRWMTAREYVRLQGAPDFKTDGFPENQIRFAMGDAVCVPVVRWIARHYLAPLLDGRLLHGAFARRVAAHG